VAIAQHNLADDVIGPGVGKIAAETSDSERRVRYLIDRHGFPVFRRGLRIYSRRSWLERYYSGENVATDAGT
jgi:hypothetical protein